MLANRLATLASQRQSAFLVTSSAVTLTFTFMRISVCQSAPSLQWLHHQKCASIVIGHVPHALSYLISVRVAKMVSMFTGICALASAPLTTTEIMNRCNV